LSLALALMLALCSCSPSRETAKPNAATPGVTDSEIVLGSSLALNGHAGYLGTQTLRGALAYLNYVNEQGGIFGRRIRVIAYDDAYDPPKCLANTQHLIIADNVFALFCYVGTPTTVKILPMVEEARIPLLGMFTGANALREPFNRYLVNVRPSYYQETAAAVTHLVKDLGIKHIAVFYQYDAYGFDGLTGAELALKEFGLEPVARGSYIRGSLDVEDGLMRIQNSGAEAVVMIGTYEPCAKFIRLAAEKGFTAIFYNVSFVGAEELARRLKGVDREIVIMSQVVPPPDGVEGNAGRDDSEYVRLLARYFPGDRPNFVGLEGYANARVLVEGLKRAGPRLSREGFLDAIESMRDFNVGPGMVASFSPEDHQGMDRVYFTRLDQDEFRLMTSWSELGRDFQALQAAHAPGGGVP
jgi:ABC-type branched-subunit amino acid transport system substrate-binding protein